MNPDVPYLPHKEHTMHGPDNMHAAVADTVANLARVGQRAVVVWLPTGKAYDVYLCAHDDGAPPTLRAVAHAGSANDATGYDKDGPTWAAHEAGAEYRRFRSRVPPHVSATRIVLPCGRDVFAV